MRLGHPSCEPSGVIERSNPAGLHTPPGYHHVTVADATRTAFLAGQCPLDEQGQLVGPGDLLAQVELGFPGQLVEIDVTAALRGSDR